MFSFRPRLPSARRDTPCWRSPRRSSWPWADAIVAAPDAISLERHNASGRHAPRQRRRPHRPPPRMRTSASKAWKQSSGWPSSTTRTRSPSSNRRRGSIRRRPGPARNTLDPQTAAMLQKNLQVIDQAIAESRDGAAIRTAERGGARQPLRRAEAQGGAAPGHDRADERDAQRQFRRRRPDRRRLEQVIETLRRAELRDAMRQTLHHVPHACRARGPGLRRRARSFPSASARSVGDRMDMVRTVRYQQGREEQTERQTKTVKIGADGELSLANISGDIIVTRAQRQRSDHRDREDRARANGRRGARAARPRHRERRRTQRPRRSEGRLPARRRDAAEQPPQRQRVGGLYRHRAGRNTAHHRHSISGAIKVSDIKGDLSANSISGTVRIASGGRIAAAKSISGDVEIIETETDGAIDVQSISGAVTLRKVSARRIDVSSVSGAR